MIRDLGMSTQGQGIGSIELHILAWLGAFTAQTEFGYGFPHR